MSSAQLALAREYGFASWAELKLEVERRDVLNSRDLSHLTRLLAEHPELATRPMEHWADRQRGEPLGYITMMRFNHDRLGLPRELPGTGAIARALIDAGAPVNGHPGDKEPPLITAASCGDAEVARALIDAGADIEAVSAPDSGGVPSGTALEHAAVFSMTDVVDVLVAAGAKIHSLEQAAAAGDITGWPLGRFTLQSRLRALVFAADHQRLEVIDQLIEAGTPVNQADAEWAGCHCTPRRATAGPPASGGCSPTAPTRASATPGTTAPRWRNASKKTVPDTARPRPSSGPSHATAARNRPRRPVPEPGHPNPLSRTGHPWVPLQRTFRNRELSGLPQ